ncbi:MAG TPA: hypothetical protein PLD20_20900 [Blastocatellia bacterium]|nr:hypothetical protein [Blastocatellia bacterium]HMV83417.1 hypothetical protein [Blastocatellia bacterium]HMX24086.1 hypothetical protein [Blastocatellia bacterium]HMY74304.1 hypothetical protein [Blastocatellia bacterium]HMZ20408.1 hypothetical protein [Blastocatellia bacterium]
MSQEAAFPKELIPYPIEVTLQVTSVFEKLGIVYLIGGSMASSIHGEPRLTNDADLMADIQESHVAHLVSEFEEEFYIDENTIRRAIRERKSFNLIYLETMFKVDVFIYGSDSWSREEMRLRELKPLFPSDNSTARYVSNPETTTLQKLLWYKKGGEVSEKQWMDVLGILKVKAPVLDYDYLHHWATELGVADLLNQALAEAGVTVPSAGA